MKKLTNYLGIVLVFWAIELNAEVPDVNFSQYFNFPALHNPSFAGDPSMDYRISGIYRQQWQGIDAEFQTFGIAGDMTIAPKLFNKGSLGLGFYAIDDHLGNDIIQNQEFGLSLAYHRPLDFQERHLISFGVNANYSNTSLDFGSLFFENQYEGFILNRELPSGEGLVNDQIQNINVGAGINYRYMISPKYQFSIGTSLSDILEPDNFFLSDSLSEGMIRRWTFFGALANRINSKIVLIHHLQAISLQNVTSVRLGTIAEYSPLENKELQLNLGAFYQVTEAFALYGGIGYRNYSLNISYDFTLSSLNEVTGSLQQDLSKPGAIEVSLVLKGFRRNRSNKYSIPCRFF